MNLNFPLIPEDLLKSLDAKYKSRCPGLEWSDRRIWFEAGARSVIDFLTIQFQNQFKKATTG